MISWRNGSASDSSPEGCEFNSHRGHCQLVESVLLKLSCHVLNADAPNDALSSKAFPISVVAQVFCYAMAVQRVPFSPLFTTVASCNNFPRLPPWDEGPVCAGCPSTSLHILFVPLIDFAGFSTFCSLAEMLLVASCICWPEKPGVIIKTQFTRMCVLDSSVGTLLVHVLLTINIK
jgi:hypothetical protein